MARQVGYNTPTLLVLGASHDQMHIMRTAIGMGLRILAVDMNPNSPGFNLADDYAVISTKDFNSLVNYLDQYKRDGHNLVGVTTMGSDIPDMVAKLSQYLGTPSISLESAYLAIDKYKMKAKFKEHGIPTPWFEEVSSFEDLKRIISEKGYPLIIKPIDSSGSRGVFIIDNDNNPEDLYYKSKNFSFSGRVQVEEYLEGPQISTETIMYKGKGITPGFADRNYELNILFKPQIMENGGWMPSMVSPKNRILVEELVEKASLALGVINGVVKGDVVITKDGPKIIEMAARLSGGDFCESLVPLSTGVNYVEAAIDIAIGKKPDLKKLEPKFSKCVANRYFFPKPGRLTLIEGIEKVMKKEWVKKLELWYKIGDIVPPALSHAHRFGVFIVTGDTRAQVNDRIKWVYQNIKIITE